MTIVPSPGEPFKKNTFRNVMVRRLQNIRVITNKQFVYVFTNFLKIEIIQNIPTN
jgi:hypothetical protein